MSLWNFIRKLSKQTRMLLNVVFSVVFLDKEKMLKLASLSSCFRPVRPLPYICTQAIKKEKSHGATADEIQGREVHFRLHCQETETRLNIYGLWQKEVPAQVSWSPDLKDMADLLAPQREPSRYRCPKHLQTKYLLQTAAERVTSVADSSSLTPEKRFVTTMLSIYSKIDIKINI